MFRLLIEQCRNATSWDQRLSLLQEITAYVMQTGPRGGRFYYTPKGRKVYRVLKKRRADVARTTEELVQTWWSAPFASAPVALGSAPEDIVAAAKNIFGDGNHKKFTPKALKKMFSASGLGNDMRVSAGERGEGINVAMSIKDSTGAVVGTQTRRFKKDYQGDPMVYHAFFELDKNYQGGGRAGALFAKALEGYQQLGVKKIAVSAGLTAGPYTWARFGFQAASRYEKSDRGLNAMKEELGAWATSRLPVTTKQAEKMLSRVKSPRDLSGLKITRTIKDPDTGEKVKVTIPVGKQFFLFSQGGEPRGWNGMLDLTDPKQVRTFKAQCKKGQKQRTAAVLAGKANDKVPASKLDKIEKDKQHWSAEYTKYKDDGSPLKFTAQQWYEAEKRLKKAEKKEEPRARPFDHFFTARE